MRWLSVALKQIYDEMGALGGKSCCGGREGHVSGASKEDDDADEVRGRDERLLVRCC